MVEKIAFIGDPANWFTHPYMAKALVWRLVTHYVEQGYVKILIRNRRQESVETWVNDLCKQTWLPYDVINIYPYTNSEAVFKKTVKEMFEPSSLVAFIYGDKPKRRDTWIKYEYACEMMDKPYHVYRVRNSCKEIYLAYEYSYPSFKPLVKFNLTGERIVTLMRSIRDSIRQNMSRKLYKPPPQ